MPGGRAVIKAQGHAVHRTGPGSMHLRRSPGCAGCRCRESPPRTHPRRRIHKGGRRAIPTPEGVPVTMMSPGASVIVSLSRDTKSATPKIISSMPASCTTCPFNRASSTEAPRSPAAAHPRSRNRSDRAGAVEILADCPLWSPQLEVPHGAMRLDPSYHCRSIDAGIFCAASLFSYSGHNYAGKRSS